VRSLAWKGNLILFHTGLNHFRYFLNGQKLQSLEVDIAFLTSEVESGQTSIWNGLPWTKLE